MEKFEKKGSIDELAKKFIDSRGERDFKNLFDRLKPGLNNYASNILKDQDAADDVVADAFAKIWLKVDTYNPIWSFSTWCYRIVHNESMQYLRKKKNTHSLNGYINYMGTFEDAPDLLLLDNGIDKDLLITQPEEMDSTSKEEVDAALYNSVIEQMEKLPSHYKDIIIDREINNMKYEEISAKYDLEINTVKTRIIRARQKICEMVNVGQRGARVRPAQD